MITKEIIEELKDSNKKMHAMLENLDVNAVSEIKQLRCELLKTLELLPAETHDDRNNRCC